MENVLLKELKSGCYINDKVLKLLPVEEISIKNQESCFLTHFENFDHLYVAKTLEKEFLKTIMDSTGLCYELYIVYCIFNNFQIYAKIVHNIIIQF